MNHDGFTQHFHLEVYTDVDWAGYKKIRKSSSTYVTMLAGCLVSLSSKRQTTIT